MLTTLTKYGIISIYNLISYRTYLDVMPDIVRCQALILGPGIKYRRTKYNSHSRGKQAF